jgi:DNA repair exonuclease SbcCD nuclease subunit
MKIALITDTHWGIRNDSIIQHNHIKKFLDDVFFPTLTSMAINHVIHLGDLVDRRKYINYLTARRLRTDFLDPLKAMGISVDIIAGNHDTFYKNTNDVNALDELLLGKYDNIKIHKKPIVIYPYGKPILLLPWICDDNKQQSIDTIKNTTAQIVMGHLELEGFDLFRGHKNDHGDNPDMFNRFDIVCSGHYHTRSDNGTIFYLGSPVQFTWSDYNDTKGFHIFDTETRQLDFIANPVSIFHKHFYDDLNREMDDILNFDVGAYKDCYVKIIVKNKTNPVWFDMVVDRIEKSGVADMQVVEDHLHLDLTRDDDIVDQAEDTMAILHGYINSLTMQADKKRVESIIQSLYSEAQSIQ